MSGIFSLNQLADTPVVPTTTQINFENFHFESFFKDITVVTNSLNFLKSHSLTKDELGFVATQLDNTYFKTSQYRFENSKSEQENLTLRAEGFLNDVWEAIKTFFRWIKEKIVQLFRMAFPKTSVHFSRSSEVQTSEVIKKIVEVKKKVKATKPEEVIEVVEAVIEKKKKTKKPEVKATIVEKVVKASTQKHNPVPPEEESAKPKARKEKPKNKQEIVALVKALKREFVKEAQISNENFKTIAILESKIGQLSKNIINLFGYVSDEERLKSMVRDSFKDFIFFSEKVESSLKDVNLFSKEGFFYNVEKYLSPFGSPVFKPFVEEAENIDSKFINHFAWFFAGYNNMSVLDFNEKSMTIKHTKLKLPEVETPDIETTANLIVNYMESGCFSEIYSVITEMISVQPRVQKRIEAAINLAESSLNRYEPNSGSGKEKAEAQNAYKLITEFFRNTLTIMHNYGNFLEALVGLSDRIALLTSTTTDLTKLSTEDVGIILMINTILTEE